ncbi:ABC transporter permease [Granulicella arctica]|uniref:ABC transporter permease n=1 Tax=Granulicella arctica TaxID=940613 RepID=UPI0021E03084|nr:ABC transporter permease [Granulicella arctica]
MRTLLHDLSFALRQLLRHPIYAATAILSMALGIGATAAVYSVLYGVLIDPFPYRDAAHIADIVTQSKADDKNNADFTLPDLEILRHAHAVTDVMAHRLISKLLTGGDFPESIHVAEGTGNYLQFLDAPPLLGRIFTYADAPANIAPQPVAVISYLFWKSHFAGSPSAVGSTIELDHQRYTVLGVMGPRFTWLDADVYLPLPGGIDPKTSLPTVLRIRPDLSRTAITAELDSLTRQIASRYPQTLQRGPYRVTVETLNDNLLGEFKGTLLTLFAAVLSLLLIGCSNVSILLLARGSARQYELAMRTALGAPRIRIIRQLLTEAVLLSVAGGVLGMAIAFAAIRLITVLIPQYSIPHEVVIALNLPVLLFSTLVSVAVGILAGLSPTLQLSKTKVAETMQATGSRTVTNSGSRTQGALIILQIALTVLLLAASGAAMRQFLEAYRARLGFDPHNVLLLFMAFPEHGHDAPQDRINYEDAMIDKIDSLPGVLSAASAVTGFPPTDGWIQQVDITGGPSGGSTRAVVSLNGADYFSVLKIPLLQGRSITRAEVLRGAHVAVVSSLFAQRYLATGGVLGRLISPQELAQAEAASPAAPTTGVAPAAASRQAPYQVIGVAEDLRNDGLHRPIQPEVYLPSSVLKHTGTGILVRTSTDPQAMIRPISKAIGTLDASQSIRQSYVFQDFLGEFIWARERFISSLFSLFALVALSLAAIGLVSVIAFRVEQRTHEIGIRSALGASRANILHTILRPAMFTTTTGLAIGILLSVGLSQFASRWTQSSMRSWSVLTGVSIILLLVAAIAGLLTARRAIQINPIEALRTE